jgi:hypothetical protein
MYPTGLAALIVNAKIATVAGAIPVSSGRVESEGGDEAILIQIFEEEQTLQQRTEKEVDKMH